MNYEINYKKYLIISSHLAPNKQFLQATTILNDVAIRLLKE